MSPDVAPIGAGNQERAVSTTMSPLTGLGMARAPMSALHIASNSFLIPFSRAHIFSYGPAQSKKFATKSLAGWARRVFGSAICGTTPSVPRGPCGSSTFSRDEVVGAEHFNAEAQRRREEGPFSETKNLHQERAGKPGPEIHFHLCVAASLRLCVEILLTWFRFRPLRRRTRELPPASVSRRASPARRW